MAVYKPDAKGFTELALSSGVRRHMLLVGEYWARKPREFNRAGPLPGPVRIDDGQKYADSITVEAVTVSIRGRPRIGVEIAANVSYAAVLEVGNSHDPNPPRPLSKMLDHIRAADPRHHGRV